MYPSVIAAAPFRAQRRARRRMTAIMAGGAPLQWRVFVSTDEDRATGVARPQQRASRRSQRVLVEAAALHDGGEVRAAILEQAEILQRIAVDHQQVGEGAGLDDAEFAFLAHDLG